MVCSSCGVAVDEGRAFCPGCGEPQADLAVAPTVLRPADVVAVELAHIPTEIRAPTAWTIAKGVFLGLLLWSLATGLAALVVVVVVLGAAFG